MVQQDVASSAVLGWTMESKSRIARKSLVLLVMAAAIPVMVFAGWVTFLNARDERTASRRAAFDTLDRVITRVSSELATQIEVAATLASSASLDQPDLSMFYREAKRLKDARPLWENIELVDPDGSQVLNLLRPMGSELGATADRDNFEKVMATKKAAIGGIGPLGPISGKRLIALRAPAERNGEVTFIVTIALVPDAVSQILRSAGAPKGWVGVVVDAKGNIVARTASEQFELGRPSSESIRSAIARAPEGSYVGHSLEGVEVDTVYRTLPGTGGWSVHLGIPTESLNAPVKRSGYLLVGGGTVSLALAVALAWLTGLDIAQRRRDEEAKAATALGISEERRMLAIETAELGIFNWDLLKGDVLASRRTQFLLTLQSDNNGYGDDRIFSTDLFLSGLDPADRPRVAKAFADCPQAGSVSVEFRTISQDGSVHWRRATGRPPQFEPTRSGVIFGVIMDIDGAKQAETERHQLLRRLAEAEENERRRIARELHDQIGQSVTGLLLGLKNLEQSLRTNSDSDHSLERINWLQGLANDIGRDIHRVAADLRPTALDDLGLYDALLALSPEWSLRFHINLDVQFLGDTKRLSLDVEIAVYRAIQEALTNILKHAKAKNVSLLLDQRPTELRVIVEDDGVGFDTDPRATTTRGPTIKLGLSGMRERLSLISAELAIESDPGVGTTIFMTVPLVDPGVEA
jgi:two-component system sensor histidine kinase UhpB